MRYNGYICTGVSSQAKAFERFLDTLARNVHRPVNTGGSDQSYNVYANRHVYHDVEQGVFYLFYVASNGDLEYRRVECKELQFDCEDNLLSEGAIWEHILVTNQSEQSIWVLVYDNDSDSFTQHLVNKEDLNVSGVIASNQAHEKGTYHLRLDINESRLASFLPEHGVKIYFFDRASGIGNLFRAFSQVGARGVEFSPDGKILYVTAVANDKGQVWQYSTQINDQAPHLVGEITGVELNGMELAPDGCIYVDKRSTSVYGKVITPNIWGPNCEIDFDGPDLLAAKEFDCESGVPEDTFKNHLAGRANFSLSEYEVYEGVFCNSSLLDTAIEDCKVDYIITLTNDQKLEVSLSDGGEYNCQFSLEAQGVNTIDWNQVIKLTDLKPNPESIGEGANYQFLIRAYLTDGTVQELLGTSCYAVTYCYPESCFLLLEDGSYLLMHDLNQIEMENCELGNVETFHLRKEQTMDKLLTEQGEKLSIK